MASRYLKRLGHVRRGQFERELLDEQEGTCFICRYPFVLPAELENMEVEHILPMPQGGRDRPPNFALIHTSCDKSTRPTDLRILRGMRYFERIQGRSNEALDREPNLDDILQEFGGARFRLTLEVKERKAQYSFEHIGDPTPRESPIYTDSLSGMDYFFALIPLAYLHFENEINPRGIGTKLSDLLKEFSRRRPQLQVELGWVQVDGDEADREVRIFDGQQKATAQILLGVEELPVRIFVNPDFNTLMEANTSAGTVLRQVSFDKAVQRRLGGTVFWDRVRKYQQAHHLPANDFSFSERDLIRYFRSESRKLVRCIVDAVRDEVSHHPENRLRPFIDFGGKSRERPLSYSTIDKTFYSLLYLPARAHHPIGPRVGIGRKPPWAGEGAANPADEHHRGGDLHRPFRPCGWRPSDGEAGSRVGKPSPTCTCGPSG